MTIPSHRNTATPATPDVLVLHGPNLNLLGVREPHIYGTTTLDDIRQTLAGIAGTAGLSIDALQSNAEHVLVDRIHQA